MAVEADFPVLDFDTILRKMTDHINAKLDCLESELMIKIEGCIKNELAKTAMESPARKQSSMLIKVVPTADAFFDNGVDKGNGGNRIHGGVDINIINKAIEKVEDLQALESRLNDPAIVQQYIEFYKSCINKPPGERVKRINTLVYNITNKLWCKSLLHGNFTWTGKSIHGPRLAFNAFGNIMKLIHAIVLNYEATATLEDIEIVMRDKICKHSRARANKKPTSRSSTGHNPHKPHKKKRRNMTDAKNVYKENENINEHENSSEDEKLTVLRKLDEAEQKNANEVQLLLNEAVLNEEGIVLKVEHQFEDNDEEEVESKLKLP